MGQRLSVTKRSEDFDEDGCLRGIFDIKVEMMGVISVESLHLSTTMNFETQGAKGIEIQLEFQARRGTYDVVMLAKPGTSPELIKVKNIKY
jgi:hypothetical protein